MKQCNPCQLATVCVPWDNSREFLEPVFLTPWPACLGSISAVHPRRSLAYFRAGKEGRHDELRTMLTELNAIREMIISLVTKTGGHMDGAFDKVYARLLDPEFPAGLLSAYQGADEDVFEKFTRWLETTLPAWAGEPRDAKQN